MTRAAERGMFADMYGVRLNFLVRYIPVNQVGLEDLRCRLYTDSRKYLMPGLDLLESGGFEPHFHCIKGEIFSNKHTPPINEFYIILIYLWDQLLKRRLNYSVQS